MIKSDFDDFFQKIKRKAYTGSDLKSVLINANDELANNQNKDFKNKLCISSILLAENDIGFYIRIMNLCMENSLYYFNCMFVHSSITLIKEKYPGELSDLNHNFQKIFHNIIQIIVDNGLLDEIDIGESESIVILGKPGTSRIYVPYQILINFEEKIFELLNKKYTKILLELEYNSETIELINNIKKINSIYTNFGKSISFSSAIFSYSKENTMKYFEKTLTPSDYDEELFYRIGILLFPLITDFNITNGKINILNNGFGNLNNGSFIIVYPSGDKEPSSTTNINMSYMEEENVFFEYETKRRLKELPLNMDLELRLEFEKFGREYVFVFKKKIGKIIEELNQAGDVYVMRDCFNNNYGSLNDNSGIFAPNSKEINQNLINNNINLEKIRNDYNELANLVDVSEMEESTREEVKKNIAEAIQETTKEKISFENLIKITENLTKLIGSASKVLPYVIKIKNYLWDYIPK